MTHRVSATTPTKLLSGALLRVRLVGAGLLFLIVGSLIAPTQRPRALETPQERPAPLIEEQVQQQRETAIPFRGVADAAAIARSYSVAIAGAPRGSVAVWADYAEPPRATPASGFGVFVEEGLVLTHSSVLAGRTSAVMTTADGRQFEGVVVAYDAATRLTLLRTPGGAGRPATVAMDFARPGALGAGVAHDRRDIVAPVFFSERDGDAYIVSEGSGITRPGLPLFDMDGALVAVTSGPGPRPGQSAVAVAPVLARLRQQVVEGGMRASLGLSLQEIPVPLRGRMGDKGMLVTHVVPGGPADMAGVEAGQVLRAVGGAEVGTVEDLGASQASLQIGVPVILEFGTSRRTANGITPQSTYEVASRSLSASTESTSGVPASMLLTPAAMTSAGIPEGAVILRIDSRRVTSHTQALRQLRRASPPAILHAYHDGAWFFAGVESTR